MDHKSYISAKYPNRWDADADLLKDECESWDKGNYWLSPAMPRDAGGKYSDPENQAYFVMDLGSPQEVNTVIVKNTKNAHGGYM